MFQLGVGYCIVMIDSRKSPDVNRFKEFLRMRPPAVRHAKQQLLDGLDGYYFQLHQFCEGINYKICQKSNPKKSEN